MKHDLAWHEECISNQRMTLDDYHRRLQQAQADVDRLRADIAIYQYQIDEAKRIGKDGFDSDKFRRNIPNLRKRVAN